MRKSNLPSLKRAAASGVSPTSAGGVFVAALAIFAIVGIQMFNDQMRLQKLKEYKAETVAEQKRQNKRWLHWARRCLAARR